MTKKDAREKVRAADVMAWQGWPLQRWQYEVQAMVRRDISRVSQTGTYKRQPKAEG